MAKKNKNKSAPSEDDNLKNVSFVKARHILIEKQQAFLQVKAEIEEKHGDYPPPAKFGEYAKQHSACSSGKKGGDLGWFPRKKMAHEFEVVAFSLPKGKMGMAKTSFGYHLILVEDRGNKTKK